MGFTLENIVPWGRSYEEYVRMFDLSEADLKRRLLGCADGPAGFNAELTRRGGNVVSVDPLYAFDAGQIEHRIEETYDTVIEQVRANRDDFVWDVIASVEELGRIRLGAMRTFLDDYERGKTEGRYIAGELPALSFESGRFDIALSSHFLFLYSDHLSFEFHLAAVQEMLRLAREVRVFPVMSLDGSVSPHLEPITRHFSANGHCVALRPVPYEFQRGGDRMLRIRRRSIAKERAPKRVEESLDVRDIRAIAY
ncbi:MAG: SAM-dependent methyltransferase [Gammaproteobacteria bacterium]